MNNNTLVSFIQLWFLKQNKFSFSKVERNRDIFKAETWCKVVSFIKRFFKWLGISLSTFAWKQMVEFPSFFVSEQSGCGFHGLWGILHRGEASSWTALALKLLMPTVPGISLPVAASWSWNKGGVGMLRLEVDGSRCSLQLKVVLLQEAPKCSVSLCLTLTETGRLVIICHKVY